MTNHTPRSTSTTLSTLCLTFGFCAFGLIPTTGTFADTVVLDDLIVPGNICAGHSCADGEVFQSGNPLKLSATGVGIIFDDTGGTNENDWRLGVNDINEASIYFTDQTAGTTPFKVMGNALDNTLFVGTSHRVGLGTSLPEVPLHIATSSPSIRFEDNAAPTYKWEIGGFHGGFVITDRTADRSPFAILPGAPNNSIFINGNGNIGFGNFAPEAPLHIRRINGTAKLLVEDTGSDFNTQIEIKKNGTPRFRFDDTRFDIAPPSGTNLPAEWDLGLDNNRDFILRNIETNFNVFKVLKTGDMVLEGALTQNSDKNAKMAIVPIDARDVLSKVEALPIATWSYKDSADVRHIGPMAQDFRALFGTGASDTGISTLDTSGVALAAIKALSEDNKALLADIRGLSEANETLLAHASAQQSLITQLAARLEALEGQIAK